MFTNRTNRKLLLLAVLLHVFSASDFAGPNARAVVSHDLISDGGDGNRACQADFDNNGIVEFADFLSFVAVFNTSSGDANFNALMDIDGDDAIGFRDFVLFAEVFGATCEPPPVVARVALSPSSVSIEEGGTHQFSATAYDSDNTMISDKTFAWTSSSTSVATVNSSGLATGVDAGSTTITATVDGVSGTASLTVTEPPPVVARVALSPSSVSIEEGGTQQFGATAYDSDNTMISGKTFTWTSSSTSVATVNASGLATGVDAGSTTITATVDGVSGTATLTVTESPPVVARVALSPSSVSIEEGGTQQFGATAYDSDNTMISGKTFVWTSSSTSVATVNSSGLATGVDAGSTTITATVDGVSGTATLTVTESPPVVARVAVSPSSVSIEEGGTHRFSATAYDSDNTMISRQDLCLDEQQHLGGDHQLIRFGNGGGRRFHDDHGDGGRQIRYGVADRDPIGATKPYRYDQRSKQLFIRWIGHAERNFRREAQTQHYRIVNAERGAGCVRGSLHQQQY